MTREQAIAVAAMFREIGGFTRVEVSQHGGPCASPSNPWEVELWSVSARAGNRNLTVVRDPISPTDDAPSPPTDLAEAKRIARKAQGEATASDNAAFARQEAEREVDRE